MKLFRGDHVVDLIRVNSCGIDYVSCLIRAVRGLDPVSIRSLFDLLRFCVEHKLYTVVTCILRECDRQAERAYDPACRRTQRPHPMQFAGSTLAFPITKICFSSVDSGVRAPVGHTSVHRVQLYRQ